MNWTLPVAELGATVAVSVTDVPATTGPVGVTASAVVVVPGGGLSTSSDTALDVDPVNAVGSVGVNVAVSECAPTVSVLTAFDAIPAATGTAPGMAVAPSKNVTEPAAEGDTVAFSVTLVPAVTGPAGVAVRAVVVGVAGTEVIW